MIKKLLFASLCFTLLAAVPAAQAQVQVVVTTQYWTGLSPYAQSAPYYYSRLCNQSTGYCWDQPSNAISQGTYSVPAGNYDVFVWHQTPYDWGSYSVKVGSVAIVAPVYPSEGPVSVNATAYPRPLAPALQSCNYQYACTYPAMTPFDLLWSNSQDAARTAPGWTMTYDILTSTKPGNGTWGDMLVTVADAPCNPNSAGKCRWHVDGLAKLTGGAEYRWKIRAKARFNQEPYTYTTDSPTTGYAYQTP